MDAVLLGLIGAMVLGAALAAFLLNRKGRRSAPSSGLGPQNSHTHFSSMDGAAISLAECAADAVENGHSHTDASSYDSSASFDLGGSFSSGDSGSSDGGGGCGGGD
jgi:hypothetical protein